MRGLSNKWRNWNLIGEKRRQMRTRPETVRFERRRGADATSDVETG